MFSRLPVGIEPLTKRDPRVFTAAVDAFWAIARHLGDIPEKHRCPYPDIWNSQDIWRLYDHICDNGRWGLKTKLEKRRLWLVTNWTQEVKRVRIKGSYVDQEVLSRILQFPDPKQIDRHLEVAVTINLILVQQWALTFVNFSLADEYSGLALDPPELERLHRRDRKRTTTGIQFVYAPWHQGWWPSQVVIPPHLDVVFT